METPSCGLMRTVRVEIAVRPAASVTIHSRAFSQFSKRAAGEAASSTPPRPNAHHSLDHRVPHSPDAPASVEIRSGKK